MFTSFRWILLLLFFPLSACVQKTDSSLTFSPDNFPDLRIKVNEGVDYVKDPNIQVTFTSSRDDIKFISLVLGEACVEDQWIPAEEITSFNLAGDDGEKPISMMVKTQYAFKSKCATKKLILDRAVPLFTDTSIRFSQNKKNSLSDSPNISWTAAQDGLSGIAAYEYSIGSTLNGTDVLPWTKLENVTGVDAKNLQLVNHGTYFPSVRAMDKAGNVSNPIAAESWVVDMDPPTIASVLVPANGSYRGSQYLEFKLSWSEKVVVTGAPQIVLNIGTQTRYAVYTSGSGSKDLIFRHTILTTDNDTDGITVVGLEINGGKIDDEANNAAALTTSYPSTAQVLVDNIAPTILSVSKPANGSYRASQVLSFTLTYSEPVTVVGNTYLGLVIGATGRFAEYSSGSGTNTITFNYTIVAGENDTNGIVLDSWGGTTTDIAGNVANNTFTAPNTSGVLVDTTTPTISSVQGPISGTYGTDQILTFKLNFSESVLTTASPRLALTIGSITRYATLGAGSGTNQLTFNYMIATGDSDGDGITVTASIDLNGGSIADAAGNSSTTGFTAPNTSGVKVSTLACPTGFIPVPPLAPYTSAEFCVAKYEMKIQGIDEGNTAYNSYNVAESRATGTPWVNLTRDQAISECQALGSKYDLILNSEWQAIARNIELVGWNWSGGVVGNVGGINRGNSPATVVNDYALAASADDNVSCYLTGASCNLTTWNQARRVHKLSNNYYIWDLAGNPSEWVKENHNTIFGSGDYMFVSQLTDASNPTVFTLGELSATAKFHFGPTNNYTSYTTIPRAGLGILYWPARADGPIHRGGHWGVNYGSGIFTTDTGWTPGAYSDGVGFRCTYH
jgi:hypothetical protein